MADKKLIRAQRAERLRSVLKELDWSGLDLKRRVEVSASSVYKWLHGECRIPGAVFAYLELLLKIKRVARDLGEFNG